MTRIAPTACDLERSSLASPERPLVALLESRMSRELGRLVEKHGGEPLCVPAVREFPELTAEAKRDLLDSLIVLRQDLVIFMTGVAVSLLFEIAEQAGRRSELVLALKATTTVCRGPKPTAALRGFGVPPTVTAREPYTSADLIDALAAVELKGRRVLLFHYGERSGTLAETLLARHALLEEQWLYRWMMPEDTTELGRLVEILAYGRIDALAVTCQIQFRHLMEVAERLVLKDRVLGRLGEGIVVAAIGPTCQAILEAYGVTVSVMPDQPKMGPFVRALMRHLEHHVRVDATAGPRTGVVTH